MAILSIPGIDLGPELGRGSQSVVVRGSRQGREYAVKVPLDLTTSGEREVAYRRFVREAVALARARNRSLPDVMEIGRSKGVPYLVMELAAGETLRDRLDRSPLSAADVVRVASQIAGALESIHSAGLIHRDVKPQNIIFDSRTNVARLVDLGSAALLHGAVGQVGTPAYAAPELLSGEPRPADVRTDLYSLGRVLEECLARVLPARNRWMTGDDSERLAHVVQRLLARDPNERPASAVDVLIKLEAAPLDLVDTPHHVERAPAPLLGRVQEIEQLRRAWAGTKRGSQVVFVQGAAGTGKTRVAKAFVAEVAEARTTVFAAACHPRDPRAFSAVRQLVDGYLRRCDDLPPSERADALAEVRRLGGEHGALLKLLSPAVARLFRDAPTIPASANAEQAFAEGLSEFLGRLVKSALPALVFVDDVQWLDQSSRRILARATVEVPRRALFLYAARSEDLDEVKRFSDLIVTKKAAIELSPLESADLFEIARSFLSTRELGPDVEQAILRLSDGTPLSVLQLLRTLVDEGALLPYWGRWKLDGKALSEMHLPRGSTSLLARRIAGLEPTTRSVLSSAAIVGMAFENELLPAAAAVGSKSVLSALAEARRAELIESEVGGSYRFIHHTVRDALLAGLTERASQIIHRRVAEALDDSHALESCTRLDLQADRSGRSAGSPSSVSPDRIGDTVDADHVYRVATHYGAGPPDSPPERVAETNVAAGEAAVTRFENERAIAFFETAEQALRRGADTLTPRVRLLLGEARLRSGNLDQALAEFDGVLSGTRDALLRAGALVRIATIHEMRFDSKRAWDALERAFRALGEAMPKETAIDVAMSAASWIHRSAHGSRASHEANASRERDEMLCALYYEVGRVAFAGGAPGRFVLSTIRALEPAERLGPSSALAKSYLVYSLLLTVLGLRSRGRSYFQRAESMARELRDPVVYAHALQLQCVIAAWDGRMSDAVEVGMRCLLEYGNWRELGEICTLAWTVYQIESIRGRDLEAWRVLNFVIQRVQGHEGQPVVHEFILLAARGALLGLGRDDEAPILLRRLEQATVSIPRDSGSYSLAFAPRARLLVENANVGADLDALTSEFASLGLNAKQAHLSLFEYYLHVAHARVHVCLRAGPDDRSRSLERLSQSLSDLDAAARKIPLFRAHSLALRGYEHFFQRRSSEALGAFEEAESIALAEDAPWVLYAVHRGRAHLLRSENREGAARDQALIAESIAREHGSVHRARWVREEFGLRARHAEAASDETPTRSIDSNVGSEETATLAPGASRARRQLRALVRISQARARDLDPDVQARLVVDELVLALRADRGYLYLVPALARPAVEHEPADSSVPDLELVAGRDVAGQDIRDAEDLDRATIRGAFEMAADSGGEATASFCVGTTARRSSIAAPLVVDDVTAGVVYVDRSLADGAFTETDGEVLAALAGQVSIALELTQALRARERAEESLRATEKMEAVARLARGIGHDVNNMLSAVSLTTEAIAQTPGADALVGEDVRAIQSVLRGAGELTRKLRDIAQGDFGNPEILRASDRIERLVPVLTGLLGSGVALETSLDRSALVFVDPGQLDQVITNLAINARDAMPNGGRLVVEVGEVELDDAYVREHPRVVAGRYVKIAIADTGHGMDADVRDKIFEPYFTTKHDSGGTGLGLSTVYWIVSRSGGHIGVASTPGVGTTFSLYFPAAQPSISETSRNPEFRASSGVSKMAARRTRAQT